MKGKKIIIISIILNLITIGVIYNFTKKEYLNNKKITVKTMTEIEYEDNIKSLNTSHEDYAKYIEESKKKIASAITEMGVVTSNEDTLETMANNIKSIDRSATSITYDYTIIDYQYYNNGTNTSTTEFNVTIPSDGYYIFCTGYRASSKPETLTTTVNVLNTIKNEYSTNTNAGTLVYQKNYIYLIKATEGQTFNYTSSYFALIKINNVENIPNITSLYQLKSGGQYISGVDYSYENTSSKRVILIYSGISAYTKTVMSNLAYDDYNTPVLYTDILPICQNGYGGVQIMQIEPNSKLNAILWYRAYNASDVCLIEY